MPRIVLDTDVASLLFKDRLPDTLFRRLVGQPLAAALYAADYAEHEGLDLMTAEP